MKLTLRFQTSSWCGVRKRLGVEELPLCVCFMLSSHFLQALVLAPLVDLVPVFAVTTALYVVAVLTTGGRSLLGRSVRRLSVLCAGL